MSNKPKDTDNSNIKSTQPANIAGSVVATEKVVPLFNAKNLAASQANFESYSAPVPTGQVAIGDVIQNVRRVDPGAALAEATARKEWVEGSGIPEHLYKLNCFVGCDHNLITKATKWGVKYEPVPGKKITAKEIGLGLLDLSKGYWYAMRFDWQKNTLDTKHAQFKPLADSFDKKGKLAKYLSTCGTGNAAYTLRVTEAEIHSAVERWGAVFPYWVELEADPERVSQLYWQWVLESGADIPVAITEGIKKAVCLIGQGIPCIALPGVNNIHSAKDVTGISKSLDELHALRMPEKKVYLAFDADIVSNAQVKAALRKLAGELSAPLPNEDVGAEVKICGWATHKGIDDFFVKRGVEALNKIFADAKDMSAWEEDLRDLDWYPHTLYNQIEKRFKKYFIARGDEAKSVLYLYDEATGAYSPCPDAAAIVAKCLNQVAAPTNDAEKAESETTAGKPAYIREMIACIKQNRIVSPSIVNPPMQWSQPGGVLSLSIEGDRGAGFKAVHSVRPHEPYTGQPGQVVFTVSTDWDYDPDADDSQLSKLLEFLPDEYKDTFLDYVSCSLSVEIARPILGRDGLPALYLKGGGSNGKDTVKNLLSVIFPGKVSGVSLRTLRTHDDEKGWSLSPMEGAIVNWSSENGQIDISKIETLKAIITGNDVEIARIYQGKAMHKFQALQVHCTNKELFASDAPYSLLSRTRQMTLPYQFKAQHEINDARESERALLKLVNPACEDPAWLVENAAAAFFNLMCSRFIATLNRAAATSDGGGAIDWSCCKHETAHLVDKSDHIRRFLDSRFVSIPEGEDGQQAFATNEELYAAYKSFAISIDRAESDRHNPGGIQDVDPSSVEAKVDPVCLKSQVLNKRVLALASVRHLPITTGKKRGKRGLAGICTTGIKD